MNELHNLYASLNIITAIKLRRMRWTVQVPRTGEMRIAYNILIGKPEGTRLLGRPKIIPKWNLEKWSGKV